MFRSIIALSLISFLPTMAIGGESIMLDNQVGEVSIEALSTFQNFPYSGSINQYNQCLVTTDPFKQMIPTDTSGNTSCFGKLTCDDKISLAQIQAKVKDLDPESAKNELERSLSQLPEPQRLRITKALYAGALAKDFSKSMKSDVVKEKLVQLINKIKPLYPYMDAVAARGREFVDESRRLRDGSYLARMGNFLRYSTAWSADSTPLGQKAVAYRDACRNLLDEVEKNLSYMPETERDKAIDLYKQYLGGYSDKLNNELNQAKNSISFASENTENIAEIGMAGGLIVASTAALATTASAPVTVPAALIVAIFMASGIGHEAAISAATQLFEAGLAAYSNNDSSFWCAYAEKGMDDHYLDHAAKGALLGIASAGIPELLHAGRVGVKAIGYGALAVGAIYQGKAIVYDRAVEIAELEKHAKESEAHGNPEGAACFRQAKTDKYAHAAIDIAALAYAFKEAIHFAH